MPRHQRHLRELEQQVLCVIVRLRDNAYGVTIGRELEDRVGRRLSFGALYATLDRLEKQGYVTSELGDPTPERGGRAKRFFTVTGSGAAALRATRDRWARTWRGLRLVPGARRMPA